MFCLALPGALACLSGDALPDGVGVDFLDVAVPGLETHVWAALAGTLSPLAPVAGIALAQAGVGGFGGTGSLGLLGLI